MLAGLPRAEDCRYGYLVVPRRISAAASATSSGRHLIASQRGGDCRESATCSSCTTGQAVDQLSAPVFMSQGPGQALRRLPHF